LGDLIIASSFPSNHIPTPELGKAPKRRQKANTSKSSSIDTKPFPCPIETIVILEKTPKE